MNKVLQCIRTIELFLKWRKDMPTACMEASLRFTAIRPQHGIAIFE